MNAKSARAAGESAEFDVTEAAAPLDLLLPAGALGRLRRFMPDFSAMRFAMDLARRPGAVAREVGELATELGRVAAGHSAIAPPRGDRRFSDPAWNENPLLKRTFQAYLATGQTAETLLADAGLGWRDNARMKFLLTNLIAAAAPSNNPLINPVAWKAVIDTGGLSAVRGIRALVSDMASAPHIPTMVAPDAFEVGKDLAATPGAVVARTDLYELIQYEPTTETVHRYPVLMVPPMINKYYVADLAPGRSMLEFFVGQGYQVFVLSWRNPGKQHSDWDMSTYGGAVVDALKAARSITKAPKASLLGLCAGGIISSMVGAHLSSTGQLDQVASLCLGVTVLDTSEAGTAVALMDESTAAASVLATRMPAALHRDFIELSLANSLTKPGAATMLGSHVDLSKIDVDTYVVAGIADHIVPWPSAYRSMQLLGGNIRFVLSNSGHIASMVNPPSNPKATYRIAPDIPPEPREWLAEAETVQGSWWPDYTSWLTDRSGGMKQRPHALGSGKFPPLQPAPGTYILGR